MTSLPEDLAYKLDQLRTIIAGYEKVAVAFSGGVDSSLLLKVAYDQVGDDVTAYFADSIVQSAAEKNSAFASAHEIAAPLVVLQFDLLSFPEFVANPKDRCYFCKKKIFSEILREANQLGIHNLADGTNLDDLKQFRPGAKAVQELGVKTPLVEAKLTKKDIRILSRYLGLSSWDKHSASCLATRIASGQSITLQHLNIIERAEQHLSGKGFGGCRVRLDGLSCTLELARGDVYLFITQGHNDAFVSLMSSLGIDKISLDLKERM
nr:ATP-dependent sacrificial sulfur transferase LarE [Desulfobulbaceae bacterium]